MAGYYDSVPKGNFYFWVTFWWLNTLAVSIYTLSGMYFFWKRRDTYPIKYREPTIVMWTQFMGILGSVTVYTWNLGFDNRKLWCFGWTTGILESMVMIAFLVARFILLYMWATLTNLAMKYHDSNEVLRLKGQEKKAPVAIKGEWILRNRHRFGRSFWATFVTVYFGVFGLVALVFYLGGDPTLSAGAADFACYKAAGNLYMIYLLYVLVTVIVITYFWRQVRTVPENFRIVEEFRMLIYIGLWMIVYFIVSNILGALVPKTALNVTVTPYITSGTDYLFENYRITTLGSFFKSIIPQYLFAYVQTHQVVRWSYENDAVVNGFTTISGRSSAKSEASSRHSVADSQAPSSPSSPKSDNTKSVEELSKEFLEMLLDVKGEALFKGYLVKEFSVENLMFWKTIRKFKEIYAGDAPADQRRIVYHSTKIYRQFVSLYAPLSINISSACKEKLEKRLGLVDVVPARQAVSSFAGATSIPVGAKPVEVDLEGKNPEPSVSHAGPVAHPAEPLDSSVFDEAQKEIFNLMVKDSFRRFRLNKEYKDFVAAKILADQSSLNPASPKQLLDQAEKTGASFFNFKNEAGNAGDEAK